MNTPDFQPPPWPSAFNEAPKWAVERAEIFDPEMERIFAGPLWHLVGHRAELDAPGRFKTVQLGRVPLILIHGQDGVIRALHNACAHRGTMLEPRFRGKAREFECPFHRWAYSLEGTLTRCPGIKDFPGSFELTNHGLASARVEEFCGLLFASLHPDPPVLEAWLAEIATPLRAALGGDGRLKLLGYQKTIFETTWKIYIDDEVYLAPLLHRAFQILKWKGGAGSQVRSSQGHRVTETVMEGVADNLDLLNDPELMRYWGGEHPRNKLPHQKAGSLLVTPWPLGAVMNHLDIINCRFANPLSPTQTEVHYAYFAHQDDDPELVRHRVRQSSNLIGPSGFISLEDGAVFGRIQKALHAEPDRIRYLRGWQDSSENDPWHVSHNDEVTNTVWWETYRQTMGFERATS